MKYFCLFAACFATFAGFYQFDGSWLDALNISLGLVNGLIYLSIDFHE